MRKTWIALLVAFCVAAMVCILPVSGEEITGSCGEAVTWELKDGILTISGTGEITSNPWIERKEEIREVIIEEGVTTICDEAFKDCSNMYGATVAASVTKVGRLAFSTGNVLEAFFKGDAPELHNHWYAETGNGLGPHAFIHYPKGNVTWENMEKRARTMLRAVSYEPIGTCGSNLTYTIDGTTLTISGTGAMDPFDNDAMAPWTAYSLRIKKVVMEEGLTTISWSAFGYFHALEFVEFPDTVTSIDPTAFSNCEKLKAVELPEELTYLGDGAFRNCKSLTQIHIYGKVNEIGIEAFAGCDSLKEVWFHADAPKWMDMIFGFEDRYDLTAYYPKGNESWDGRAIADAGDNVTWKTWTPDGERPETTEPKPTEPIATAPKPTEPVVTEPVVTEPVVTEPVATEPVVTEPIVTEPVATEPEVTEPKPTEPKPTEPRPTEPGHAAPVSVDLGPVIIAVCVVGVLAAAVIFFIKKRS